MILKNVIINLIRFFLKIILHNILVIISIKYVCLDSILYPVINIKANWHIFLILLKCYYLFLWIPPSNQFLTEYSVIFQITLHFLPQIIIIITRILFFLPHDFIVFIPYLQNIHPIMAAYKNQENFYHKLLYCNFLLLFIHLFILPPLMVKSH